MKDKLLDYTSRCVKQGYDQRIVTAAIHTRRSQEVERLG